MLMDWFSKTNTLLCTLDISAVIGQWQIGLVTLDWPLWTFLWTHKFTHTTDVATYPTWNSLRTLGDQAKGAKSEMFCQNLHVSSIGGFLLVLFQLMDWPGHCSDVVLFVRKRGRSNHHLMQYFTQYSDAYQ